MKPTLRQPGKKIGARQINVPHRGTTSVFAASSIFQQQLAAWRRQK
jgi:hypothetical protein